MKLKDIRPGQQYLVGAPGTRRPERLGTGPATGRGMLKIDTTPTLYSHEKAEEVAAALTAGDDDGWTYHADHGPEGSTYARVEARDENGEHVGFVSF